jgi:hypothetical protein
VVLKVDIDAHFLYGFVMKVFEYVKDPAAQADLTAYLKRYLGTLADAGDDAAAAARRREAGPVQEIGWCQKHGVEMTLNHKDDRQ